MLKGVWRNTRDLEVKNSSVARPKAPYLRDREIFLRKEMKGISGNSPQSGSVTVCHCGTAQLLPHEDMCKGVGARQAPPRLMVHSF